MSLLNHVLNCPPSLAALIRSGRKAQYVYTGLPGSMSKAFAGGFKLDYDKLKDGVHVIDLLIMTKLCKSRSEAKRQLRGGQVHIFTSSSDFNEYD